MKQILERLKKGDISILNVSTSIYINSAIVDILNTPFESLTEYQKQTVEDLIIIGNIIYTNSVTEYINPIDDGMYDLLMEIYKKIKPDDYKIGSISIDFNLENESIHSEIKDAIRLIDTSKTEGLFLEDILYGNPLDHPNLIQDAITLSKTISKRTRTVPHQFPELSGTLDKNKFVLISQAVERGVENDDNVTIFERDFLYPHVENNITDPNDIKLLASLKYDGVSVVLIIEKGFVTSAYSRGDTVDDLATDLTPIFYGLEFPYAKSITKIGVQFEAVMSYENLEAYRNIRGIDYKNPRTAIIGLLGASDAIMYRNLITLVPIKSNIKELNMDRLVEVDFLNRYFAAGEYLRHTLIQGNCLNVLFLVKKFVEECEYYRNILPIMYDGVVLEYIDPNIITKLGRVNSVNKYSIAIKFNPLKKQTMLVDVTYTVGQNGVITPIAHYNPIEFFGAIHTKTTISSKARFDSLDLHYYDIVDVEYVNDVIPYMTKSENEWNLNNKNKKIEFPDKCPCCGSDLKLSSSGKSIICPNMNCGERSLSRIVNLMSKLHLKDFSTEQMKKINKKSLKELLDTRIEEVEFLGDVTAITFMNRINELKNKPYEDYKMIGALGFSSIAAEKWAKILKVYNLQEIVDLYTSSQLRDSLCQIKGIGPITAETIDAEFEFFLDDIYAILSMENIVVTKNKACKKKIRFTGFRNKDLEERINSSNDFEYADGGVTKDTYILLTPNQDNYLSSKVYKAMGYNIPVMKVDDFILKFKI